MWNFMVRFLNNKGFTLIEYLLGISLVSILLISIFSLFHFTNESLVISENHNDTYLNGQYGLEYIKREVLTADKIISSSKIKGLERKFPNNIGFVLMIKSENKFTFITYYIENNNLIRIASNEDVKSYPNSSQLKGFNEICTNIISFNNTNIDVGNKLLNLSIDVGKDNSLMMNFKTTVFLRCLMDF